MHRAIEAAANETETLEQLHRDEANLTRVLDAAREAAAQVECDARAEAARIRADAARLAEQELAQIRHDAEHALSSALAEVQADTDRRLQAMRQQAQQGREKAIALVLDVVLGKASL